MSRILSSQKEFDFKPGQVLIFESRKKCCFESANHWFTRMGQWLFGVKQSPRISANDVHAALVVYLEKDAEEADKIVNTPKTSRYDFVPEQYRAKNGNGDFVIMSEVTGHGCRFNYMDTREFTNVFESTDQEIEEHIINITRAWSEQARNEGQIKYSFEDCKKALDNGPDYLNENNVKDVYTALYCVINELSLREIKNKMMCAEFVLNVLLSAIGLKILREAMGDDFREQLKKLSKDELIEKIRKKLPNDNFVQKIRPYLNIGTCATPEAMGKALSSRHQQEGGSSQTEALSESAKDNITTPLLSSQKAVQAQKKIKTANEANASRHNKGKENRSKLKHWHNIVNGYFNSINKNLQGVFTLSGQDKETSIWHDYGVIEIQTKEPVPEQKMTFLNFCCFFPWAGGPKQKNRPPQAPHHAYVNTTTTSRYGNGRSGA